MNIFKTVEKITLPAAAIGAVTWGTVALANFNLVETLAGSIPWLLKTIYIVVGVGGVLLLPKVFKF